jgi:hypothetical protein
LCELPTEPKFELAKLFVTLKEKFPLVESVTEATLCESFVVLVLPSKSTQAYANPCCKEVVTAPPSDATVICSLASTVKKVALAALVTFSIPPLPILVSAITVSPYA